MVATNTCTPLQPYWKRAFNLQTELKRAYGVTEKLDLQNCLSNLRISCESQLMTAMEEVMALSSIVQHMMRDGYSFTNAEWIQEQWERKSSRVSPTAAWIFGLSWDITPDDISSFLHDCHIVPQGILICLTRCGHFSGKAIIQFSSPIDLSNALLHTGEHFGGQRIVVRTAGRYDFDSTSHKQTIIRKQLFGLFSSSKTHQHPSSQDQTTHAYPTQTESKWSGALNMVYQPETEHFEAFSKSIHNRMPLVSNTSQSEPVSHQPVHTSKNPAKSSADIQRDMKRRFQAGTIVFLRGLPYSVSEGQILEFFSSFSLEPNSLALLTAEDGRASGEALIAFTSPDQAAQAVRSQSGKFIGSRYVELFLA